MFTFENCKPQSTRKQGFYQSLVNFYTEITSLAEKSMLELNEKQTEYDLMISDFFNGKYIYPDKPSNLVVLDKDKVNQMRPYMKHKVALYDALVNFMESTLNPIVESKTTDKLAIGVITSNARECADFFNVDYAPSLIAYADEYDENVKSIQNIQDNYSCQSISAIALEFIQFKGLTSEFEEYIHSVSNR